MIAIKVFLKKINFFCSVSTEHSVHHVQSPQQRHCLMEADGVLIVFVLVDLLALSGITYGMILVSSVIN